MPRYTQQKIYDHPADVYPRNVWRSLEALVEISSEISEEDIPIFRSYSHRKRRTWPGRDSSREMRILSHADGTVMGWNGMKGNENESRNELARISRDGPYQ